MSNQITALSSIKTRITGTGVSISPSTTPETTASILQKLAGATPEAGKIGTEFIPNNLSVDEIVLADTTGVQLEAGSIGLNSNGEIVLHDNATPGGVPIDKFRIAKSVIYPSPGGDSTVDRFLEIGRMLLPASDLAVSPFKFNLVGKLNLNTSYLDNYTPTKLMYLVFYLVDSAGLRNPADTTIYSAFESKIGNCIQIPITHTGEELGSTNNIDFSIPASLSNTTISGEKLLSTNNRADTYAILNRINYYTDSVAGSFDDVITHQALSAYTLSDEVLPPKFGLNDFIYPKIQLNNSYGYLVAAIAMPAGVSRRISVNLDVKLIPVT